MKRKNGLSELQKFFDDSVYQETMSFASRLDDRRRTEIGHKVIEGYRTDKDSRRDWEEKSDAAMKMAMQVTEEKTYPWPRASNVVYPLLSVAAMQFNARSYSALINGSEVVSARVVGFDPDGAKAERAERISKHMSWQLLDQQREWREGTDKMLSALPVCGVMFRKVYFDVSLGHNVSKILYPTELVINAAVEAMDRAPRVSEIFSLYQNEIEERRRQGLFLDEPLGDGSEDDIKKVEFIEQHCYLDLDEDGLFEPYIVTVEMDSGTLLRVTPRFEIEDVVVKEGRIVKIFEMRHFIKYGFFPSPDGSFYDIGFGTLLSGINKTVTTLVNQLIDAGHLANTQGGFIGNGLSLKKGSLRIQPGEFKPVNAPGASIRENIVQLQFPGPSGVLFNLLGMLIESANNITSIQDIMVGKAPAGETATTTMARVEQSAKLFSSIVSRIHRSMGDELKILFKLNAKYLDPIEYFNVLDGGEREGRILQEDYDADSFDVYPASDPSTSSDMHRVLKAQSVMQLGPNPLLDQKKVLVMYLKAIGVENPEDLMAQEPPHQGPPPEIAMQMAKLENEHSATIQKGDVAMANVDVQMKRLQMEMHIKMQQMELEMSKFHLEQEKVQAENKLAASVAIKNVEQARSISREVQDLGCGVKVVGSGEVDAEEIGRQLEDVVAPSEEEEFERELQVLEMREHAEHLQRLSDEIAEAKREVDELKRLREEPEGGPEGEMGLSSEGGLGMPQEGGQGMSEEDAINAVIAELGGGEDGEEAGGVQSKQGGLGDMVGQPDDGALLGNDPEAGG